MRSTGLHPAGLMERKHEPPRLRCGAGSDAAGRSCSHLCPWQVMEDMGQLQGHHSSAWARSQGLKTLLETAPEPCWDGPSLGTMACECTKALQPQRLRDLSPPSSILGTCGACPCFPPAPRHPPALSRASPAPPLAALRPPGRDNRMSPHPESPGIPAERGPGNPRVPGTGMAPELSPCSLGAGRALNDR